MQTGADLLSLKYVCAGSTQGIGLGMLQGLARAGANVVMHGLVTPEDARKKQDEIEGEFGVKCGHSAANVMKPAEIRYAIELLVSCNGSVC